MKKTFGSETTYYFYGVGGLLCEFTTTNTGTTQASSTNRILYRTSDRLGTAVLLIAVSGTVLENNRTLSYGESWLPDVGSMNDKKFTTYQRDQESGLDYAMARFYGDYTGRFMSPDPLTSSALPKRSQTWHRYLYNWNDPINLIDPSGLAPRLPKTTAGKWKCTPGADGLEHCQPADPDEEIGSTTQEGAPQLKTSESDSARDFLLCVGAHVYNNFFGTEDQAGLTVAVHVAIEMII